jgi:succinyl-CoA synthetase alpha subunit
MSILLHRDARVAIVGITGKFGRFSIRDLTSSGTTVVAGISPGRGGEEIDGIPIHSTASEAVQVQRANAALVYVPASGALDAVIEAFEAGFKLVAYPGDGLPVRDAIEMRAAAAANGGRFIGPNSPGIFSPGVAKLGFMPSFCFKPGPIGLISRSGSLSYECASRLSEADFGQTTFIGIGGDPIKGVNAGEAMALFHNDPQTRAIVYLGEIGSMEEYDIAAYARRPDAKPIAALLVGRTAPPGKKMGHAAAMIGSAADTWSAKIAALESAGVHVARNLDDLVQAAQAAAGRTKPVRAVI